MCQNIGAKSIDRAKSAVSFGTKLAVIMMATIGLILFLIPDLAISLFSKNPKVIEIGCIFLRYLTPSFGFIALSLVLGRSLNGTGDTFWPMALTFISQGGLLALFVIISFFWNQVDLMVIWIGISVSNLFQGGMRWVAYHWRMAKVEQKTI